MGVWDSWVIEEPWIIDNGNEYLMYYGGAGSEAAGEMINGIGLATGTDGMEWIVCFKQSKF